MNMYRERDGEGGGEGRGEEHIYTNLLRVRKMGRPRDPGSSPVPGCPLHHSPHYPPLLLFLRCWPAQGGLPGGGLVYPPTGKALSLSHHPESDSTLELTCRHPSACECVRECVCAG